MLLLLGSVGLIVHAHEALPELASLAAMCGALATLPHAARRPLAAGALFGALPFNLAAQTTPTEREAARDVVRQIDALQTRIAPTDMAQRLVAAGGSDRDRILQRVEQLWSFELRALSDHIGRNPEVRAVVVPRTAEQRRFLRWLDLPSLVVPDEAVDALALTSDGGKTWRLVGAGAPDGYRSGAAWVPGLPRTAIAVGPTGSDVTTDAGRTWTRFDTGSFDAVDCAANAACWASGEAGRAARLVGAHD
jgi:hypothetical protein